MKHFLQTCVVAGALLGNLAFAESEPALATLPIAVGEARVQSGDGTGVYSVSVSGPLLEKSQEIRFIAYWDGFDPEIKGRNRTTRTATVKTGKTKTLAEVVGSLKDAFSRFLAAPPTTAANQDLVKIGNIKYGGELHLIAESNDVLRFDYQNPSGVTAIRFGKNEISEFLKILKSQQ